MVNPRRRAVQPYDGEILEVVSESPCTSVTGVVRRGRVPEMKFTFANHAVLYVPLPRAMGPDPDVTLGPMTS